MVDVAVSIGHSYFANGGRLADQSIRGSLHEENDDEEITDDEIENLHVYHLDDLDYE